MEKCNMKKYILILIIFCISCVEKTLEVTDQPLIVIDKGMVHGRYGNNSYYLKTFNGQEVNIYVVSEDLYNSKKLKDSILYYSIK